MRRCSVFTDYNPLLRSTRKPILLMLTGKYRVDFETGIKNRYLNRYSFIKTVFRRHSIFLWEVFNAFTDVAMKNSDTVLQKNTKILNNYSHILFREYNTYIPFTLRFQTGCEGAPNEMPKHHSKQKNSSPMHI
jgi:hypothetical protein